MGETKAESGLAEAEIARTLKRDAVAEAGIFSLRQNKTEGVPLVSVVQHGVNFHAVKNERAAEVMSKIDSPTSNRPEAIFVGPEYCADIRRERQAGVFLQVFAKRAVN